MRGPNRDTLSSSRSISPAPAATTPSKYHGAGSSVRALDLLGQRETAQRQDDRLHRIEDCEPLRGHGLKCSVFRLLERGGVRLAELRQTLEVLVADGRERAVEARSKEASFCTLLAELLWLRSRRRMTGYRPRSFSFLGGAGRWSAALHGAAR